ncbi:Inhibitor of growth protein 3, partial [Nibea albiflora]
LTTLSSSLAVIEQLPMDLRDRFTEMREMDLQVQNATDQLEQKVIEFFVNAKKNKPEWREEQMEVIKKVDRHLRKLDQELAKFKMELEADNAGITEILERRCRTNSTSSSTNNVYSVNSSQPLASYNLSSLPAGPGAGAGAITMAAAQAVQATAQMKDGRRTSSLKASYEAIKNNDFQLSREFALSRENTGYSSSALASTLTQTLTPTTASDSRGRKSKSSIKSSNHQSSSSSSSSSLSSCSSSSALAQELSQQASALPEAEANSQVDWTYDPNEPRYCICNQVSYGEMVGCDNTDCPIEWFHYGCVGLTEAPKGKWYCPQCTAAMKRRGSRHK